MSHSPLTIELDEPILTLDGHTDRLTLRPPTARDIQECGFPYSTERNGRTGSRTQVVNTAAARLLIAHMSDVPVSSLDRLSAADFSACIMAIEFFFNYKAPKKSAADLSKLDDGPET